MRFSDVALDACTFPSILKACGLLKDLDYGTEMHGLAVKCGFVSNVFVVNSLVSMYSKCDDFHGARVLFDRMTEKEDVVSWNSMISAYSSNGKSLEALSLFREMQMEGVFMNSYTVVGVLQACQDPYFLRLGMEIHGALLKSGWEIEVYGTNALLVMYSRCGNIGDALRMFRGMNEKDNVSWNSMLSGFVQNELFAEAISFFCEVLDMGHHIDEVSVISIISALGRLGNLFNGMEVHACAIKHAFDSDLQVGNTIIDMYAKCGSVNYMAQVFDKMPEKDMISWTTVIAGNAQNGCYSEALELFRGALKEGMKVDAMMIGSALLACSSLRCASHVRQIHCYILRQGLLDLVLENTIVDSYGECTEIDYASRMFEKIENKDVVSWTSMISCYVHKGFANEALELFYRMGEAGIEPDMIAMVSVISACASLSALKKGKEIHAFLTRKGFSLEGSVVSSLVDMYAHCGCVNNSYRLFNLVQNKDLILWTSMINASGMHGDGKEAINFFHKMLDAGLKPDHITFLALLHACSHSGLIEEGRRYLGLMRSEYKLEPWPEHYVCLVDLLARAKCLTEAYNFVNNMTIEPTAAVWCALLGACRVHSDNELGEIVANKLLKLDPDNPGNYVLASNVFASKGRWKDVDDVRMRMRTRGLKKNPACSWIEVGNKVHAFMVRDKSHPQSEEIYSKLTKITERLEWEGYVAETKFVLHNVQEEEKKKMLYGHSERLAITFGLIETPAGQPIQITKNLRVCGDCHVFTKLVSKFFERKIIVRDSNRFHHFEGGVCSCGDFW
ncbi:Pentatricopeptide repeat [Thalictrum thalictroides]|uniref:Pentatricopeptide repeat n=1 Tax=Thalictrum thalictroides TaxID=46969 RepID=A0A7J6VRF7_THATH|nr:Pentatricopeptide repeat [Thalictrum thalictroides]